MHTFVILVGKDSLRKSESGAIWGEVWCQFDSHNFPEANWTDLIVAILIAWLEALYTLISGSEHCATVFFMDGPFHINVRAKSRYSWEAELVSDRRKKTA